MTHKRLNLHGKLMRYIMSFNYGGLLGAVMLFCCSLLPSVLPRPALMQGVISGISLAVGYGLGVLASKSIRWFTQKDPSVRIKRYAWRFAYVFPVLMLTFVILGHNWQNEVRVLVGQTTSHSLNIIQIILIALIVFHALLGLSRSVRKLSHKLSKFMSRWVPRRIGKLVGIGLTTLLVIWVLNGFLFSSFVAVSNAIYANSNDATTEGISKPQQATRSGSPDSVIPWESLGSRGRDFVARGPSQEQLEKFSGQKPTDQVRIYVGVKSADTARERAKLAVQDLKRAGGFERGVLIIATATGSGWLEPQSVDSIEYMHNGNTAIVSQQYSYLPSWISFLVDSENAKNAGRELYDAVYNEWIKLPVDSRPKLIAYGLSLGSFGAQSTFSSAQDVRRSVDGALFMGTPSTTELWQSITATRDANSPQIKPIYEQGQTVRFASNQTNIRSNTEQWQSPRTLYVQHASDPVIWWNFDLITAKPDWLRETRGEDVSPKTKWIPFVTFFQVTVDQFYGVTVPNGHGHNYANTIVDAWAAVAPATDWSEAKSDKLQALIDTYANE